MSNTQQINIQSKIEQIKKEIDLLQDRIRLMHIRRIRVKKGQRTDLSQTKEMQNIVKDTLQNKANRKEYKYTTKHTCTSEKNRTRLFEKGLKKIAKIFHKMN